ncbi:TonB-dependent receptor [Caulobacter sp.]|uniref:TonB-dependent receptor n=1 Tax=Caulobacter sp. TaxID=78 RepID=UPI001B0DF235|nr:TonB-dependent receptor [Caulobacter sp.]MBO9545438.1 TonB-dependent receptor [Caulobacter sp.]
MNTPRVPSRHALLLGASLLGLGLTATNAAAQQAPAEDPNSVEAVVVTGFRASLASAITAKRRETGVVDVIKAEDIAAFPDLNLAESLQRIPGVAITRVAGEGRQISVRGLGPEYTRVRINGMEALATSGGSDSGGAAGNNRGRGFDFNVFASELFNGLTVRKTASADVEEGSLGATVDLASSRPFDFRKPTLVLSAQMGYNDLSKNYDPRFAALASKTWADGKLGALLSVAYGERDIVEDSHGTTRWGPGGANGGFSTASTLPGYTAVQVNSNTTATAIFHPRNPSFNSFEHVEKRLGVTASLQARPTDRTLISLNALYGKLDGERDERLLQAISFSRSGATGKPATIIRDGVVNDSHDLVYGVFDNVDMRSQASHTESTTTFKQFTLDFEHRFNERFQVKGLAGHASSVFDSPIGTTVTYERLDVDGYSYDYRQNDRLPLVKLPFDPVSPSNWATVPGFSALNLVKTRIENTFDTAKLEGAFDLTSDITLRVGADTRKFKFNSADQRRIAGETDIPVLTAQQMTDLSEVFSGYGKGLGLPDGSVTSWLVPNIDKYAAALNIYSNTGLFKLGTIEQTEARSATGRVEEQNTGAFVEADFRTSLFGRPLRGDAGVRYLKTEQNSEGYAAVGSKIELVNAERSYDKYLPSLNLTLEVTDDVLVRFGAAKTMARPGLGSLRPGGDISVQGGNRSYSTGNPDLKPTQSKNLDLSFEWYPAEGAIYAVGLFQKDISTFVQTLRTSQPFNTLGLPNDILNGTIALPTDEFDVSRPVNTNGGKLKGLEISLQQRLTFLPGWLSHFGVMANYTHVTSDIEYLTSDVPGAATVTSTLVGLSKDAANGTLYYETDKFSIRGSLAYRSGYLTQVPGRNSNFVEGTNKTFNVDMQATYTINERFQLSLEGINLTDEANDRYVDVSDRPWVYGHTGRQFYLGLRYSF